MAKSYAAQGGVSMTLRISDIGDIRIIGKVA